MEDAAPPPVRLGDRRRLRRRRIVDPDDLVVETITAHAESLLRLARRYTGCATDAEDAYQRALEIFVRHAHRLDGATAYKWLHTVVKHEALAVRAQRAKLVGVEDEQALDALDDGRHVPSVEERSERFEELTRAAEALRRLKPQEATALVLKAQGLSYAEIAERQGWTYTKVNRCVTEGRRSFLRRYAGIEAGEECARWSPTLSAMADGEATAAQLAEARPHLRNCPACRAMLGELHRGTAQAAALLPAGLLAGLGGGEAASGLLGRLAELLVGMQERLAASLVRAQTAVEAANASKVAAVAASAAAVAGGGVAVERHVGGDAARAADRLITVRERPEDEAAARAMPPRGVAPERATGAPAPATRPDAGPAAAQRGGAEPPRSGRRDADAGPEPGAEFAAEADAAASRSGGDWTPERGKPATESAVASAESTSARSPSPSSAASAPGSREAVSAPSSTSATEAGATDDVSAETPDEFGLLGE